MEDSAWPLSGQWVDMTEAWGSHEKSEEGANCDNNVIANAFIQNLYAVCCGHLWLFT